MQLEASRGRPRLTDRAGIDDLIERWRVGLDAKGANFATCDFRHCDFDHPTVDQGDKYAFARKGIDRKEMCIDIFGFD